MKYAQNCSNMVKYEKCKGKGPCEAELKGLFHERKQIQVLLIV